MTTLAPSTVSIVARVGWRDATRPPRPAATRTTPTTTRATVARRVKPWEDPMSGARPMSSLRCARSSSSAPRHTSTSPPTAIDTGHTRLTAKRRPMAPSTRSTATSAVT